MGRAFLTAGVSLIALGGAMTVAPAIATPLFPPPSPRCRSLAGDRVVLSSPEVKVYRGVAPGRRGAHDWACGRSAKLAAPLGADPGTRRFPRGETIRPIVAAGPWVAAFESSRAGFRGCPASVRPRCPLYHHQVELIAPGAGSSGSTAAGASIATLQLSSMRRPGGARVGAVVWLERLHGSITRLRSMVEVARASGGSASIGVVAQGRIALRSVRLVGLRVRFVEAGRRRSVRLRAG
jgi:hypothetical protein